MLYNYVLGWLEEAEARQIRSHLAWCGACAREALHLMQLDEELVQETLESAKTPDTLAMLQMGTERTPQTRTQPVSALRSIHDYLVRWTSELWEPQWAGQLVTAADVAEQSHVFRSEHGDITMSCYWQRQHGDEPAHIHIFWKADLFIEMTIWLRFFHPETRASYHDVCLGTRTVGEETFTSQELDFDPSAQRWALSVILAEND
jgi:hypothetical protein